jgi:SPX domain protein involved in polyphosphate accumulation
MYQLLVLVKVLMVYQRIINSDSSNSIFSNTLNNDFFGSLSVDLEKVKGFCFSKMSFFEV